MERFETIFKKQKMQSRIIAQTTIRQRIEKLRALEREILKQSKKIQEALLADLKKPVLETNFTEIFISLHEIRHTVKNLAKWMRPEKVRRTLLTATVRSEIRLEPKGVVLVISPWNFPINLSLTPLISAVAAGNCVILKPSEFSPNASQILAEIISAVFSEDEVAVVQGDKNIATRLLELPFDHIFFTGNSEIGKYVMKAAADHHASVTLELGGKSPVIVDATANLDDAAKKLAIGKFMNCGQACIAPDYILVQNEVHDQLLTKLIKMVHEFYGSNNEFQASSSFGRIINQRQFKRVQSLLEVAIDKGAIIECGGTTDEKECYISPTFLTNLHADSSILHEEIFGPVLPIIPFTDLKEAIEIVNDKPKPLVMYIFSQNKNNIEKVLNETHAGGTTVNDFGMNYLQFNLPFGGTGMSGFGSSHGLSGLRAFSHERAVAHHHRWSALKLFAPPYTKFKVFMTKMLIKYL